ncbi:ROK family protein [Microbacterium sp. 1P10UB]|uniref:ROK family protein n=1 Tax=unclassified Microbacterium TaxID=2609290 RepID=UPI0039A2DBF2
MIDPRAIGIDVGGTSIKAVIADLRDGRALHEERVPTPAPDPDGRRVCAAVAELLRGLPDADDLAVGVVVPGVVDEGHGRTIHSVNLGWRELPLAAMLQESAGRPVGFGHDVRAGALAELRWGAAVGETGVVAFVPIGTGIAAAILVDGRPVVADGWAGEVGQALVGSGPHTGERVEAVASAAGTARRAAEKDARRVVERMVAGDAVARQVWDETVAVLAEMIANLSIVVAPRTIVVGGGLALAGDALLEPLATAVGSRLGALRVPELRLAALGDRAAALGAALLAEDRA